MEASEIIEGNKLIAKFMQVPKCDRCPDCGKFKFGPGNFSSPIQMSYHTSWDWLMPVVEKIEDIENYNFHIFIGKRYTRIIYDWTFWQKMDQIDESTDLKAHYEKTKTASKDYRHTIFDNNKKHSTFTAVVDFIKWYNVQPNPKPDV